MSSSGRLDSPNARFDGQVAGHKDSMLVSSSGSVVIKPCLPVELAFYTEVGPTLDPELIGRWTPRTYGTLRLEGKVRAGKEAAALHPSALTAGAGSVSKALDLETAPMDQARDALVLENLTYPFLRPNVIDVKLGSQLWDEDAPPEKRARMEKTSASTTSGTMSMRLTGFRIWNAAANEYDITTKDYGKSITAEQLPEGIRKIFPISREGSGLPVELLRQVLSLVIQRLTLLRHAVSRYEWRVRGGSVLIVYEGDAAQLRTSLQTAQVDPDSEEEDSDESSDGDSENSDVGPPRKTKAFDVRLIDFAHARLKPGEGPDEGYNTGLTNLEQLLRARLDEL